MKVGKKSRLEAFKLLNKTKLGEKYGLKAERNLCEIVQLAKFHHSIQERRCNEELPQRAISREENIERKIKQLANQIGLTVRFDGDPRGYTVKLFFPGGETWNTWGGPENGYGVGEK